jgi:hypothetical protein
MKICNNFCEHCGTRYEYQASGHGCGRELNDAKYCPTCKKAILKVLKKIPKKFKWKHKGTDEVTLEQLLLWEKESTSPYRQIGCGLFNLETNDSQYIRVIKGKDDFEGVKFWLSEWKLSPEYTITKEVRWNIIKDCPEKENEYFTDTTVLLNPLKSYPEKTRTQADYVIPLTEPVGLTFALKYFKDRSETKKDEIFDILENGDNNAK